VHPAIAAVIKDAQSAGENAEEARILYVAMTRARDRLVLACGRPGNRGWSWSAKLDEACGILNASDGGMIAGNDWAGVVHTEPAEPPIGARDRTVTAQPIARDWNAQLQPIARCEATTAISVSELLARMSGDTAEAYEARVASPAVDPLVRGTLTHAYLQAWEFSSDSAPDVDEFVRNECRIFTHRAESAADLCDMAARFRLSPIYARLRGAESVRKELPFLLRLNGTIVSGTIDVLIDGETVLDYKTGARRDDLSERYTTQLALYAAALERITGRRPRKALLYYVDTGEAFAVDVGDDAIAAALDRAASVLLAPANV
jgi:ATP-dependent exoDNAse (exonuclease V) beta subunit